MKRATESIFERRRDGRLLYLVVALGCTATAVALWNQHFDRLSHSHRHIPHSPQVQLQDEPSHGSLELSPPLVATGQASISSSASATPAAVSGGLMSREAEQAELDRRSAFFQRAFELEPRDRVWSSTMEQTVREAYPATTGVDAVLVSAECHSTTCRLEFKYDGPEQRAEHLGALAHQFEDLSTAVYTYPDEVNGRDRVVAYFARTGFALLAYQASASGAAATPH